MKRYRIQSKINGIDDISDLYTKNKLSSVLSYKIIEDQDDYIIEDSFIEEVVKNNFSVPTKTFEAEVFVMNKHEYNKMIDLIICIENKSIKQNLIKIVEVKDEH